MEGDCCLACLISHAAGEIVEIKAIIMLECETIII